MDTRAGLDGCGNSRRPLGFDRRTVQPVIIVCLRNKIRNTLRNGDDDDDDNNNSNNVST